MKIKPPLAQRQHKALLAEIKFYTGLHINYYPGLLGAQSSALCHEFKAKECKQCPICLDTGNKFCKGTPYFEITAASVKINNFPTDEARADYHAAVDRQLKLLRRLAKEYPGVLKLHSPSE